MVVVRVTRRADDTQIGRPQTQNFSLSRSEVRPRECNGPEPRALTTASAEQGSQNVPVKGQTVNTLGFEGYAFSAATTQV